MKYIFAALLAFMICCCTACSEAEEPHMECEVEPVAGDDNDVTGTWKLVIGEHVFDPAAPRMEDYSCDNIIYHFRDDGLLSISSDVEDHLGAFGDGQPYELVEDTIYATDGFLLKLGSGSSTINYLCSILEGVMELDDRPLEGPLLTLVRVTQEAS
ncbi:hypothetical protein [Negadavirga shengliensis]|uniref:Lipocalin-like domain-containing protein n=1 Tax=Negadavirga shengliensis TaxID=1389218 RepID=A0ABV9T1X2_9BACT